MGETTKLTDAEIEAREIEAQQAQAADDAALCAQVIAASGVAGFRLGSRFTSSGDGRAQSLDHDPSGSYARTAIEVRVYRESGWGRRSSRPEIRVSWRWGRPEQTVRYDARRPDAVAKAAAKIREFAERLQASVKAQAEQQARERAEENRMRAVALQFVAAGLLPADQVEDFARNSFRQEIRGTVGLGPFPTVRWTVKFDGQRTPDGGFVAIENGVSAATLDALREIPTDTILAALAIGNAAAPVERPVPAEEV